MRTCKILENRWHQTRDFFWRNESSEHCLSNRVRCIAVKAFVCVLERFKVCKNAALSLVLECHVPTHVGNVFVPERIFPPLNQTLTISRVGRGAAAERAKVLNCRLAGAAQRNFAPFTPWRGMKMACSAKKPSFLEINMHMCLLGAHALADQQSFQENGSQCHWLSIGAAYNALPCCVCFPDSINVAEIRENQRHVKTCNFHIDFWRSGYIWRAIFFNEMKD